ncbi:MAG: addiction module protein [Verrucomicrobia bacterium]|nr:addiction module protein [Verrucomicrobiota bacterium]
MEEFWYPITVADLAKLSLREKLQLMEAMDVPEEHRRILDERRSRIASGEARLLDWDQVKHSLGRT